MKEKKKISVRLLLAAFGATFLTACGFGGVDLKWAEEVQLANGQVIVIQRTAKGEVQGEGFALTGWAPTEMTLAFEGIPAGLEPPPKWRTKYTPILLNYEATTRTWSVIATFNDCSDWHGFGKPAPPYAEYRSDGAGPWRVVPLEERFIGWKTNLLAGPSSRGEPDLLKLSSKEFRGAKDADLYRKIVAESKHFHC